MNQRRRSNAVRNTAVAVAVLATFVAASLFLTRGGNPGVAILPSPSASPTPSSTANLKPYIKGMIDRAGAPPAPYVGSFSAFVVNIGWGPLQAEPGGPIASNNAIDAGIAQVRRLNADGAHLVLKLRVYAGTRAPDWAKQMDGSPIAVKDPLTGRGGTVGRFWLPDYEAAYADFERQLASKYDSVPEISEVTISGCMTVYDEVLMRQVNDSDTVHNLLAAGYNVAADQACQEDQIDAHRVWERTRSGIALNPYQVINPDGTTGTDEAFTESLMDYCRKVLGLRCVLENNSLHPPISTLGAYGQLHAKMKALGPPISLQTAGAIESTAFDAMVTQAIQLIGTNAIEVPQVFAPYPPSLIQSLNANLDSTNTT
jgi:hypothetical protein